MLVLRFGLLAAILLGIAACSHFGAPPDGGKAPPARLRLKVSDYSALAGWSTGARAPALAAFQLSCRVITTRDPDDAFGGDPAYGQVGDWLAACRAALAADATREAAAGEFFEQWFQPVQAFNDAEARGLFTGYYEPELDGSLQRSSRFRHPLYGRPQDLVEVDLGQFRPALKGERLSGRVVGGRLVPYASRQDIVGRGLEPVAVPVVYVDDAVAAFFLQIQGSGRIRLDSGEIIRAAYDGQNGHPYTAIGKVLVDQGAIPRDGLSMQSIRDWLVRNPDRADEVMNQNASYVFFKKLPIGDPARGANGAQGVPLTPSASLAVDLKFHGLGAPMWVEAGAPDATPGADDRPLRQLFIAQDTGGAIRGPVRGDVYWGSGREAESVAGRMAHKGVLHVLLPKPLAARID
jgi:membrane-bound lytic murein transglycosylase A